MTLDRQIQDRVSRVQIPEPRCPVRQPLDTHGPEHRLQRARVTGLNPRTPDPLIADDLLEALLADCPQRQMISQQPAQQLPPVPVKTLLKLRVRQPSRIRPVQETDQRLELLLAARERSCTIAANRPLGQEFIARGVKFATAGVEIGDHVGHLRGRRWI